MTKSEEHRISISRVLKILGVSRSGYNSWLKRNPSDTKMREVRIKGEIQRIHEESKEIYGAPKITKILQNNGEVISERTVGKYMREIGVRACWVRPWIITTTNSDFSKKLINILNRDFSPEKPNESWCTDITYIWTEEGFVYLISIMDLYSRKIISWEISKTMEVSQVIKVIERAKKERKIKSLLVIHSDRGSQYVSKSYQQSTEGMIRSYSDKANPWDNACIESFHALIKREWLNRFRIKNYEEARRLVFEYIHVFYNSRRIHSHCSFLSPSDYEDKYLEELEMEMRLAI